MKRVAILAFLACIAFMVWSHCFAQCVVLDCSCTGVLIDLQKDRAREALLRQLCASAAWRVTTRMEITKEKKVKEVIEAEQLPKHLRTFDELMESANDQVHVTMRFESSPPGYWKKAGYVLAKAGAKVVRLVPELEDNNLYGSDLLIDGGSVMLQIREYNVSAARTGTQKAMRRLAEEFTAVRDNIDEIERNGYLQKWLPNDSVRESKAEFPLEIREGSTRGMYWVSGYINPQERGFITIRTFHAQTGKELDAEVNSSRTVQYLGWSSQSKYKFCFGCELPAPSYLTEEESKMAPSDPRLFQAMAAEQTIRIEVWFHGKQERKLLEATKLLVPWMR